MEPSLAPFICQLTARESIAIARFVRTIEGGEFPNLTPLVNSEIFRSAERGDGTRISNAFVLDSGRPGWSLVLFGGIHGNERCGVFAAARLIDAFSNGALELKAGKVVIALGHEEAIMRNTREGTINLNRQFHADKAPQGNAYERERVEDLKYLIRSSLDSASGPVLLLDNHSTLAPSPEQYAILPDSAVGTARIIGIPNLITGWGELEDVTLAGDTETFAARLGAHAITLESGQSGDPRADEACFQTTLQALMRLELATSQGINLATPQATRVYRLLVNETKRCAEFSFQRPFENLAKLEPNETIGRDSVKVHVAPDATGLVMVLPALRPEKVPVGGEIYKIAREVGAQG